MKLHSFSLLNLVILGVVSWTGITPLSAQQVPQQMNYQGRVAVGGMNFTGQGRFKFALVDAGVNYNQAAQANTFIVGGQITALNLFNPGYGYATAPVVTISGDGTGATAEALLGQGTGTGTGPTGTVYQINITNAGSGYTYAVMTVEPPPPDIHNAVYWSHDGTSNGGAEPTSEVRLDVLNGLYSVALGDTSVTGMTIPLTSAVFNDSNPRYLRVWFNDGMHGFQQITPDQKLNTVPYAFKAETAETVPYGSITGNELADGAVTATKLANGAVGAGNIANAAISPSKLLSGPAPTTGQVLSYDGTQFNWIARPALQLPYYSITTNSSPLFYIGNAGSGVAIQAEGNTAPAISAFGNPARAMTGYSTGNHGIYGETNAGGFAGIYGKGMGGHGVQGVSGVVYHSGVYGISTHEFGFGGSFVNTHPNGISLEVAGKTKLNGELNVQGNTSVTGQFYMHGTDLWMGHATRRGSVGRAIVDWRASPASPTQLHLNFGNDWQETVIGGGITQVNALRTTGAATIVGNLDVDGLASVSGNMISTGIVQGKSGGVFNVSNQTVMSITSATQMRCHKDFEVNGNIIHHGAIQNVSDERLKDISGDYPLGLDEIGKIRTVRYAFKHGTDAPAGEPRVGVTAQALRDIMPEAVKENPEGYLTMSTEPIFWAMVNAIKTLKSDNDHLNDKLKSENAALKKRLDALEARLK